MFTGIDVDAVRRYISPKDPDKNNPTVFFLAALDTKLQGQIEDKCTVMRASSGKKDDPAEATFALKKRNYDLVRFGVRNIENFMDPKTKAPVVIKLETISHGRGVAYQALPERIVDMLGVKLIDELAEEISKGMVLSEEEEGN